MEERKTIFDYLVQVLVIFAVTIIFMTVTTALLGESAQEISAMFRLGGEGLAIELILQFLSVSVVVIILRYIIFTDVIIKKMPTIFRLFIMIVLIVGLITVYAAIFNWFPLNRWEPWVSFGGSFIVFFAASVGINTVKTSADNKKMDQALKKLQDQWEEEKRNEEKNRI